MNLPNFHKLDEAVVIHSHKYISKLKGTSGFLCCNQLFKWISTMELYRESSSISVGIKEAGLADKEKQQLRPQFTD